MARLKRNNHEGTPDSEYLPRDLPSVLEAKKKRLTAMDITQPRIMMIEITSSFSSRLEYRNRKQNKKQALQIKASLERKEIHLMMPKIILFCHFIMNEKFLSVVWYKILPAHYGGQQGIANFNQYLGHKISLSCLCSSNNIDNGTLSYQLLPALPVNKTQFVNPLVRKKILSLIHQQKFSHIILEHPYHAWLANYRQTSGFKLIVHAHNIEFLRMKQRGKWWWRWVKQTEKKAFRQADFILFKTEKDKKLAIEQFKIPATKCLLLPYGIHTASHYLKHNKIEAAHKIRQQYHMQAGEKIFLFAGTLTYEPNQEALQNIVQHILPLLRQNMNTAFRIFICGNQSAETIQQLNRNPNIIATGFVHNVEDYFLAADVFINPVVSGSGVQTKNFDAIAYGTSVATTSYAAEGLPPYLTGQKVLIAPDNNWPLFTQNVIQLSRQSVPTPPAFYQEFYWGSLIDKILNKVL